MKIKKPIHNFKFNILKKFIILTIVESLLFQSVAFAAESSKKTYPLTTQIMSEIANGVNQYQQMMTQGQNQRRAQQPPPTPVMNRSKYLPQCNMPAAMTDIPMQCGFPEPQYSQEITSLIGIAENNKLLYENMLREDNDRNSTDGVSCLEREKDRSLSLIEKQLTNFKEMIANLNQQKEKFTESVRGDIADLNSLKDELNGGDRKNINTKGSPFKKYFTPACQDIIGKSGGSFDKYSKSGGLFGMQTDMDKPNVKARATLVNQTQVRSNLNKTILKIKQEIQRDGLSWGKSSSLYNHSLTGKSIETAISNFSTDKSARFDVIKSQLSAKVGYNLEKPRGQLDASLKNIVDNADSYFTDQYLTECIIQSGTFNSISNGIKFNSRGQNANSLKIYKEEINRIMQGTGDIGTKTSQIKALDGRYGNEVELSVSDENGSRNVTPTQFIEMNKQTCTTRMAQNTRSQANPNGVVRKNNIEEAKALLREVQDMNDSYAQDMGKAIYDQVINCGGEKLAANECSGSDQGVLDQGSSNFCLSKAVDCSSQITNCMGQVNGIIAKKKGQMNRVANAYNQKVGIFISQNSQMLSSMKNSFNGLMNNIDKQFNMTGVKWPQGLLLKIPKMQDKEFGVFLHGDGKPDEVLGDLADKLEKMVTSLNDQKGAVKAKLVKYIGTQKSMMAQNKTLWDGFIRKCTGNQKAIGEQMKAEQAAQKEAFGACYLMQQAMMQGCNGENAVGDLLSDQDKVHTYAMIPGLMKDAASLSAICNHKKSNADYEDKTDDDIRQMCGGDKWEDSGDQFSANIKTKLENSIPPEFENLKTEIVKAVMSGAPEQIKKLSFDDNDDEQLQKAIKNYKMDLMTIQGNIDSLKSSDNKFKFDDCKIDLPSNKNSDEFKKATARNKFCDANKKLFKNEIIDPCQKLKIKIIEKTITNYNIKDGDSLNKDFSTNLEKDSAVSSLTSNYNSVMKKLLNTNSSTGEGKGNFAFQCNGASTNTIAKTNPASSYTDLLMQNLQRGLSK